MNHFLKIFFLTFLFFFIEKECFSQNMPLAKAANQTENQNENQKIPLKQAESEYDGLIFQGSYSYWYHNSLSLNIVQGNFYATGGGVGGQYIGLGANFALVGKDIIISPQIVAELNLLFLVMRGTIMYMTDFKQRGDIMFKPEIGFGFSATSITLGYNIVIDKQYGRTPSYISLGAQIGITPKGKLVSNAIQ